jgi:hypothetical protein
MTDPIGYTYEADTHCLGCAFNLFGMDSHGFVPEDAVDSEGNGVGAIAPWDEWEGELYCGTCHGPIND